MHVDKTALELGAVEIRGREKVARSFVGRMGGAQPMLVNGAMGGVWAPGGQPRVVFNFKIIGDKIVEIELIGDPQRLRTFNLELYSMRPANLE